MKRVATTLITIAWAVTPTFHPAATHAQTMDAAAPPTFQVDRSWPRPLPNNWTVGPVSGIAVGAGDHIWIVQRAEAVKQAGGSPAPNVIEFDPERRVVQAWGGSGAGYQPEQVHGISIDHKDRVWISGNDEEDTHILVFSRDGKFLRQIARPGRIGDSNDTQNVGRATKMRFDPQVIAKEAARAGSVWDIDFSPDQQFMYVADGGNRKMWVLPCDTLEIIGSFGGPGKEPGQFGTSLHHIFVDSKGNLYTGEAASGGCVQKFTVQSSTVTRADRFPASGGDIEITPINHASVQVEHAGKVIHVDPWRQGDYSRAKAADLILVTDTQNDHLDPQAIQKIRKPWAPVVIPATAVQRVADGTVLVNGEQKDVAGVSIQAVAAYDLKPGEPFHPKGRANGYIVTLGGVRIYFAGVTECVPEVQALRGVDVAFLAMHLPHERMTPQAAAECVRTFRPKVVYPYHYRDGNVKAFKEALKGEPIEVRLAEWYPATAR